MRNEQSYHDAFTCHLKFTNFHSRMKILIWYTATGVNSQLAHSGMRFCASINDVNKYVHSHKRQLVWTCTGMKVTPVSCEHPGPQLQRVDLFGALNYLIYDSMFMNRKHHKRRLGTASERPHRESKGNWREVQERVDRCRGMVTWS